MAYGTVAEVKDYIPELDAGNTNINPPDDSAITTWLDRFSAEVDGVLNTRGTSVPVTNTSDVKRLSGYVVMRVAANTISAIYGPSYDEKVRQMVREYDKFLEKLEKGTIILQSEDVDDIRTGLLKFNDV